jgi:hypothetical protein
MTTRWARSAMGKLMPGFVLQVGEQCVVAWVA